MYVDPFMFLLLALQSSHSEFRTIIIPVLFHFHTHAGSAVKYVDVQQGRKKSITLMSLGWQSTVDNCSAARSLKLTTDTRAVPVAQGRLAPYQRLTVWIGYGGNE